MMHRNKVIQSYFGSKNVNGLYQFIINHFPKHDTYIEGFLGSGIILQQKKPALKSYAFELDTAVIDKWNYNYRNVEIIQQSFLTHWPKLAQHIYLNNSLVYLDPPYLPSTRTSKAKYNHELTPSQHEELLSMVLTVNSNYVISCYDNEMYAALLKHWNKSTCVSMTRGGKRIETIYFNFEVNAGEIDTFNYAGHNFTDRQRIKRKVARSMAKLENLPLLEQQYLLSEIKRKYC